MIKVGETTTDASLVGTQDALHMPMVLCKSQDEVYPGSYVKFVGPGEVRVIEETSDDEGRAEFQGVVDPFMDKSLYPSEKRLFLVFLAPGLVSGLRHEFSVDYGGSFEIDYTKTMATQEAAEDAADDKSCRGCY